MARPHLCPCSSNLNRSSGSPAEWRLQYHWFTNEHGELEIGSYWFQWHKRRRVCRSWRQDTLFSMSSWEPTFQNAPKWDTGRYGSPVAADDCLMTACIVCPSKSKAKDVLPRCRGSGGTGGSHLRSMNPEAVAEASWSLTQEGEKYSALYKRVLRRTGTMYLELPCAPLHSQLRHTPSIPAT